MRQVGKLIGVPAFAVRQVRTPEQVAASVISQVVRDAGKEQCPTCKGKGWLVYDVPVGHELFGKITPCEDCAPAARKVYWKEHCGLMAQEFGYRLNNWRLGSFPENPEYVEQRRYAKAAMSQVLAERQGLLTFWGDFGSGKSRALATMFNEAIDLGMSAVYVSFPRLLEHLRGLVASGQDSSSYWERLLGVRLLAVDEVTRFQDTPWVRQQLFVLADTRYRMRNLGVTAFATNEDPNISLPPSEDVGYLYSRMREGILVELCGDMRPALAPPPPGGDPTTLREQQSAD